MNLQVKSDFIGAPVVAGHTAVVPRILSFHSADDEATVAMDAPTAVHQDRSRGPIRAGRGGKEKYRNMTLLYTGNDTCSIFIICRFIQEGDVRGRFKVHILTPNMQI